MMIDKKQLKKGDRGSFDYTSDGDVHCTIWHDNCVGCEGMGGVDVVDRLLGSGYYL